MAVLRGLERHGTAIIRLWEPALPVNGMTRGIIPMSDGLWDAPAVL